MQCSANSLSNFCLPLISKTQLLYSPRLTTPPHWLLILWVSFLLAQELDSKGWKEQEDMDLEKNVGHSRYLEQSALIKKENEVFLINKEIQNGAVAKS